MHVKLELSCKKLGPLPRRPDSIRAWQCMIKLRECERAVSLMPYVRTKVIRSWAQSERSDTLFAMRVPFRKLNRDRDRDAIARALVSTKLHMCANPNQS